MAFSQEDTMENTYKKVAEIGVAAGGVGLLILIAVIVLISSSGKK
jgi:hypothetical protein